LKTNVWIKNLDILSTQYYQIKSIYAVNEQTVEFEFIFLIGTFAPCPVSHKQISKWLKNSKTWFLSNMQTVSMSHQ